MTPREAALVPEPTEKMVEAGCLAWMNGRPAGHMRYAKSLRRAFAEMIAAAPAAFVDELRDYIRGRS